MSVKPFVRDAKTIKIRDKLERRRGLYGYLFSLPFIFGAIIGIGMPIISSIQYSLSDVKGDWIWFKNYHYIFREDPYFIEQLLKTLQNTLFNVPVVIIFSFFLACVLNAEFKGRGFARAMLFLPMILCSKAVTIVVRGDTVQSNMAAKAEDAGTTTAIVSHAFTIFLERMGVSESITTLLTNSVNNITNILALSVIPTIIILAGLQSVSRSIYEASFVEGATSWEVLWKISLPMVSPILIVALLYCFIDSFSAPGNTVIDRVRNECFNKLNFGVGSAIAWSYILLVIIIIGIIYFLANRFVHYER